MSKPLLGWAFGTLHLTLAVLLFWGGYIEGQRSVRASSRVSICAHECLGPHNGRCAWLSTGAELYSACSTDEPLGDTIYDTTPPQETAHG